VVLRSDGARGDLVKASREEGVLRMAGHDTFRQAVDRLSETTLEAVAAAGCELIDVDLFVYHQANSRIIRAVGDRLGLLADRVVDSVPKYGNTSAASIPLALAEAERDERLPDGATVLIAAFGGGLTWGATVVQWGESDA
jgi:3-oxoacyl-[acyl-carrier-protein] synthase III